MMTRIRLTGGLIVVAAALSGVLLRTSPALADIPDKTHRSRAGSLDRVAGEPRYQILNINNLWTWLRADGQSNHSPTGDDGMYFPRGTRWVIYQDGFVWGGKAYTDPNYSNPAPQQLIRVGGQTYNVGTQSGRIIGTGANAVAAPQGDADNRIFRIRRDYSVMSADELTRDAAESYENLITNVTGADISAIRAQYEKDWMEWPVSYGAPYIERNGQPGYQAPPPFSSTFGPDDLISGNYDEPGLAGADPNSPADQVIWTVANDLDRVRTTGLYGSEPLGLEVQITLWGYKRTDALGDLYFKRAKIINKGGVVVGPGPSDRGSFWIDSMYISQWSDSDLGAFGDDLCGCDTTLSLGFAYNANALDSEFRKLNLPPPAVGYSFLQGPMVAGAPTDSAVFNLKRRYGFRNLPLTSFSYFAAGSSISDPPWGYEGSLRWWRMLQGYAPDASTAPWRRYPHPPGITPTPFPLSGDPLARTGFVDGQGVLWSLAPGDRRIVLSSGPFRLAPGDTQEVVLATIGGLGADRLSSITAMKFNDRAAKQAFRTLFAVPNAPPAPQVRTTELDEALILEWGSDLASVQRIEEYAYPDRFAFEGYVVYQLPSATSALSEGAVLATYDRINGIGNVVDDGFDRTTGLVRPMILFAGTNSGIRRHIEITHDFLRSSWTRLRNGQEYHFAVTSYTYSGNPLSFPRGIESSPRIVSLRPRIPFGLRSPSRHADTLEVRHITGRSEGRVVPFVVDPLRGTGDVYEVRFDTVGGNVQWLLHNVSKARTVLAGQTNQSGDDRYPIVEGGILLTVTGPAGGLKSEDSLSTPDSSQWGWRVIAGDRKVTWVGGNLGLQGFRGAAGAQSPYVYFSTATTEPVPRHRLRRVHVHFAPVTDLNGTFNTSHPNASYAYRYGRLFNSPPARPEFAPFIVNPSSGYAFQDYTISMPLAVYDVDTDPPRRLAVGFLENNASLGTVNGKYWPPDISGPDNVSASGPREWLFIFDEPYSGSTANPALQREMLQNPLPVMYWTTWTRLSQMLWSGNEILALIPDRLNFVEDVFQYQVPAPENTPELQQASARAVGVFPNPFYGDQSEGFPTRGTFVTFNNLPPKAVIRIFNLAGQLVRTLHKDDPSQFLAWDLRNEHGWPVAGGMYLCHVEMPDVGGRKVLKLAIIQEVIIPPVR